MHVSQIPPWRRIKALKPGSRKREEGRGERNSTLCPGASPPLLLCLICCCKVHTPVRPFSFEPSWSHSLLFKLPRDHLFCVYLIILSKIPGILSFHAPLNKGKLGLLLENVSGSFFYGRHDHVMSFCFYENPKRKEGWVLLGGDLGFYAFQTML